MNQTTTTPEDKSEAAAPESTKTSGSSSVPFRNPKKSKPTHVLPSDRLTCEKQLEALRAFVAATEAKGGPVTNEEAGDIINMSGLTVVVTNAFFTDTQLLIRGDSGQFTPGQVAKDYQAAYVWDPSTAGAKLAPAFRDTWFAKALTPRLKMRPLTKNEAIAVLAEACKASPEYQSRLVMIVEFLSAANVVSLAGDEVRSGSDTAGAGSAGSGGGNGSGAGGGGGGNDDPPRPPGKPMQEMLLAKFPEFDPSWPDDIKTKWFEGFEKLMKSADPVG